MVQLREKNTDMSDIRKKGLLLQNILKPLEIPLIINDFVEFAAEIKADGIHIGQQDMSAKEARKILGPNNFDDLYHANNQEDVSYVTASTIFLSSTKPNCKKIWGPRGIEKISF